MENLRAFLAKAGPIGVAIPAMVAHNYLQGKVHKVVSEIKEESGILLDALAEKLRGLIRDDTTVIIRGDRDVPLQTAVSVMETAKKSGAARLVVATIQEGGD